jgi:hypothetical protein
MRLFTLLLLLASAAFGGIANLQVIGVTPTQAVISYLAPDSAACTVEASTSATYSPLIYDVDPALFSGSNLDSRTGAVTNNRARTFVLGTRTAEVALDGRRLSRALQTETAHYFRVTCGVDAATGDFVTANIALGSTYNEALPTDPANPGVSAWPSIDWSGTDWVIDPQTGVRARLFTRPGQGAASPTTASFTDVALGTGWNDASNVLVDDSNSATTTTQNPLFVARRNLATGYATYDWTRGLDRMGSFLYVQLRVKGTSLAAAEPDRTFSVCLSVNGSDCAPNAVIHDVTLTDTPDWCKVDGGALIKTCIIGTTVPVLDYWTSVGNKGIAKANMVAHYGVKATLASGILTIPTSSMPVGELWDSNSRISLCLTGACGTTYDICNGGTPYAIANVNTPRNLTITVPPADGTYDWCGANFGVLIQKKNSSADQISLQYIGLTTSWSTGQSGKDAGMFYLAAPSSTNGGWRLLLENDVQTPHLMWINTSTGETRFLGLGYAWYDPPTCPGMYACSTGVANFQTGDPNVLWCLCQAKLLKETYVGTDAARTDGAKWDTVQTVHVTNVATLVYAYEPTINSSIYPGVSLWGVQNNLLYFMMRNNQGTMGWMVAFDPLKVDTYPGCVGGGKPGCVVAVRNTWSNYPCRWCGWHTYILDPTSTTDWSNIHAADLAGGSNAGAGPFTTTLASSMGLPMTTCPDPSLNILGIPDWPTGDNCSAITVTGNPCDPTPAASETARDAGCSDPANYYFLQLVGQGDWFLVNQGATYEMVRYLIGTGNSWTVERHYGYYGAQSFTSGATLTAKCGIDNPALSPTVASAQAGHAWWNSTLYPHGTGQVADLVFTPLAHGFDRGERSLAYFNYCPWAYDGCEGYRTGVKPGILGQANQTWAKTNPTFAGASGVGDPNTVNTHPAFSHPWATDNSINTYTDARGLCQSGGVSGTFTLVSGQLWSATGLTLNRKQLPTIASCGSHPLLDISGPGSSISTTSADSYKYCVALKVDECRSGAAAGSVWVNCPKVNSGTCPTNGASGGGWDDQNICVAPNGAYTQSLVQMGLYPQFQEGIYNRIVSRAFSRYRWVSPYWNFHLTPDGKHGFALTSWLDGIRSEWVDYQMPTYPGRDSVNRGTFVPVSAALVTVPVGTDNAIVEFGYNPDFYCTSRQEVCVANAGAISESTPFYWASETYSGLPCGSGCTVVIPALSQRILYYRVKLRNVSNEVIYTSPTGMMATQ